MAPVAIAADDTQELEKLLDGIRIPPQPETLLAITRELHQKEPDLPRVSDLVRSDVALSAGVLKVVNSAQFGVRARIRSVHQAITLLGLGCITNLLSATALKRSMESCGVPSMPRYWDSAAAIASAAMELARRLHVATPDEAYTLGLFCDAGIPLLAGRFPDYLETLKLATTREAGRFTDIEEARYSTNHAVIGYYVASTWHLSDGNREAIRLHHSLDEVVTEDTPAGRDVESRLAVLKLSEHAEHLYNRPNAAHRDWEQVGLVAADYLGLSELDCDELMADLVEQLRES